MPTRAADGSTSDVGLGDAAKQVAEKMEFSPGKVNNAPVRARVVLPLVYQPK